MAWYLLKHKGNFTFLLFQSPCFVPRFYQSTHIQPIQTWPGIHPTFPEAWPVSSKNLIFILVKEQAHNSLCIWCF